MPLIHDAFRFELDLNVVQRDLAGRSAGVARYVWNWGLAERKRQFEENEGKERFITAFSQINAWVKAKPAWAYEASAWCAVSALGDLDVAFKRFQATRKSGRRVGFPRFKARGKCRDAFKVRGAIKVIDERRVQIPSFGLVKIKGSTRRMSAIGFEKILCATLSRTADRWFVSVLVEREHQAPTVTSTKAVGIDLGLTTSLVLSTGEEIQGPRALKAALLQLRRANQALARSQRNSKGHEKARLKVAKVHARVADVRRDWQHKTSDRLTQGEFTAIGIEKLAIPNLANKKRHNGRSWADLGAGGFIEMLKYKAERRGITVVVADRFYASSQICSGCGHRQPMPLEERWFRCRSCGLVLGRDLNAAINLCPVAVTPTETLNDRGEIVRPKEQLAALLWQIPVKREPDLTSSFATA